MKVIKELVEGDNTIIDLLPKYTKKDFSGIIFLISNINNKFFTHRLNDDWMRISKELKYSLFGQNYYRTKIEKNPNNIFNLLFQKMYNGNSFSGLTDGYEPTTLMKEIYKKWILNNQNSHFEITDIDMKEVRITKDIEYVDFEREYSFSEKVSINVEFVNEYISSYSNESLSEHKEIVTLKEILGSLNSQDELEIFYKEAMSGRYYSIGKNHIQGIKKNIRKVLLNDYYEYDLNTSAPVLLCQIYKKISGLNPPESIIDFIDEKVTFREIFGLKHSITLKESKMIFTALFFDARLIPNDHKMKSKLTKELGVDKVNYIVHDKYLKNLIKDISLVYKTIAKHYEEKYIGQNIVGYKNKEFTSDDKKVKKSKIVSHIYQSLESLVLDNMVKFYTTKTNDTNYVRIHDCIYTKVQIDEVELENYILQELGLKVSLKDRNSTKPLKYFVRKLGIYDKVYQCWGPFMNDIIYLPEGKLA